MLSKNLGIPKEELILCIMWGMTGNLVSIIKLLLIRPAAIEKWSSAVQKDKLSVYS